MKIHTTIHPIVITDAVRDRLASEGFDAWQVRVDITSFGRRAKHLERGRGDFYNWSSRIETAGRNDTATHLYLSALFEVSADLHSVILVEGLYNWRGVHNGDLFNTSREVFEYRTCGMYTDRTSVTGCRKHSWHTELGVSYCPVCQAVRYRGRLTHLA